METHLSFVQESKEGTTNPNGLKSVEVIFDDPQYNYTTSVNGAASMKQLRDYFVGTSFNVAPFPGEVFKKCVNIKIK
ncbi:MAG: hypothetical protein ACK5M9_11820 [Mycobacterium sp.]